MQEYKIFFEQTPVSVNEIDENGCLLSMNRAKLDFTGILEEHDILGQPFLDLIRPEERLQAAQHMEHAFEGNAAKFGLNPASSIQTARGCSSEAQRIRHLREEVEKEERERIAAHLHDLVGQALQSINLGLKRLRALKAKDGQLAQELLNDLISDVGTAIGDLRDIGKELRPIFLERMDFPDAVRFHCRDIAKRTGVEIRFLADVPPIMLQERVKEQCFLSFREALANALRHARANQIDVSFLPPSTTELPLIITDDGVGFDTHKAHQRPSGLGLAMIRERVTSVGGSATIHSQPGKGTSVEISVPLAKEATV